MIGLTWHDNALWIVMHNRDGLDTLWPGQFTAEQNAEWPAEYLVRATDGLEFRLAVLLLQQPRRRSSCTNPGVRRRRQEDRSLRRVHAAGRRRSPDTGRRTTCCSTPARSFPRQYQGGAFVAFHGSWNRAPLPQAGYNVTFVPFAGGKPGASRNVRRRVRRQDAAA